MSRVRIRLGRRRGARDTPWISKVIRRSCLNEREPRHQIASDPRTSTVCLRRGPDVADVEDGHMPDSKADEQKSSPIVV